MTQMTIDQALDAAMQHHAAGRLQQAEAIYRQILAAHPNHADALHLLGLVALQVGQIKEALALIERAIAVDPRMPAYHSNRGQTLAAAGRLQDAVSSYQRALELQPDFADALNGLGNAHQAMGRFEDAVRTYQLAIAKHPQRADILSNLGIALAGIGRNDEAVAVLRQALVLHPNSADAHLNLGNAFHQSGMLDKSIAAYRKAIALNPNLASAHSNLGAVLREKGEIAESIQSLRRAISLSPGYAEAHNNLGMSLRDAKQPDEAILSYKKALELRPAYPEALNNLGEVLQRNGRLDEALTLYRQALALRPDYAAAYSNLGSIFQERKQLDAAMVEYRKALAHAPQDPIVHFNIGLVLLRKGDFKNGLAEIEWHRRAVRTARFSQPEWDGTDLNGKRILLFAEEGFGDTIQFARYIPSVIDRGGQVIFGCQPELIGVMRSMDVPMEIVPIGTPGLHFDVQCPLLSLPAIFQTTPETIPAPIPYLRADSDRSTLWRARLSRDSTNLGIVWAGRPELRNDRNRSIPLSLLQPVSEVAGIRLLSLQKGAAAIQVESSTFALDDWTADLHDFVDTAALIDALDLVITVDTAVAHLAGAMGKPVWVLLPLCPDWRWLLDRPDSPWYPTMRLFRQREVHQWDSVIDEVAGALKQFKTA